MGLVFLLLKLGVLFIDFDCTSVRNRCLFGSVPGYPTDIIGYKADLSVFLVDTQYLIITAYYASWRFLSVGAGVGELGESARSNQTPMMLRQLE
jgi:hypothetical protein